MSPISNKHWLNVWLMPVIAIQLGLLSISAGCHRSFYRQQADIEASRLVQEKTTDPRWPSADGSLEIVPQSRMFDPFSADHAPIPPDDPASQQLMQCVDGRPGYPHWHANGDASIVENPTWKSYLPVGPDGKTTLSLDRAFELATIHAPQFQQQRETLYLSALDVSLQRFGFDSQLFVGFNHFISTQGRLGTGTGRSATNLASSLGANGQGLNLRRLGITGATFTAGLANTLIWNLAGNNTQSASTLFDFSIIQPLLRGAGRARIMESLTQSERTLLANIRQYERFRRGFYLQVAIGRNPGAGPNRNGDFLGLATAANRQAGGYLGLLQQQQLIRNLEFNLRLLEGVLEQFSTFYEEDRIDLLQLRQFEATVFQQQQNLLNARVSYQSALDSFKQVLGLPPSLDIVIEDPFLDRFKIIGDSISLRLTEISRLRIQTGVVIDELVDLNNALAAQFPPPQDDRPTSVVTPKIDRADIEPMLATANELKPLIEKALAAIGAVRNEDFVSVVKDVQTLGNTRPARIAYLRQLRQDIASGKLPSEVEPQIFSDRSIPLADDLMENLSANDNKRSVNNRLATIDAGLNTLASQLASLNDAAQQMAPEEIAKYIQKNFQLRIPDLLTDLDGTILELALLQAEARSNMIEIPKVSIGSEQAYEIARCFRRDWMNARASLVDHWRRIEFVADQLESQVDLVFEGNIGNVGDNPFKLRYETGQLRAGLRVDAPIVRQKERNDYSEALIAYQQSRRRFYQFEDEVSRNLRQIIRDIDRNKVLFELNRQSIQVNIDAVELSRFRLEQPPRPGASTSFGQTTARDLSQAINGLNQVQNQYVQAYVQYEILRRSLDFDMGTMQLDLDGNWLDPGSIDSSIGSITAARLGIDSNCKFCQNIDTFDFTPDAPPTFDAPQDFASPPTAPSVIEVTPEFPSVSTQTHAAPINVIALDGLWEKNVSAPQSPDLQHRIPLEPLVPQTVSLPQDTRPGFEVRSSSSPPAGFIGQ